MQIKRTKVIEFYEAVIPEDEDDPGTYGVKRELWYERDVYYEVILRDEKGCHGMMVQSRPYKSITKEIERQRQKSHERTVKRQARLIERTSQ